MRLIQHKKEAYWFYRFLSTGYDRWVNPLFWTPAMRTAALDAARLDERRLRTLDAGAGTGFTTEGIVERVDAECVTMLDQSPHQLRRAERKPALAACAKVLATPRRCRCRPTTSIATSRPARSSTGPRPSAGSRRPTACWRPAGWRSWSGRCRRATASCARLAELWMLFPTEAQYREWFVRAGFEDVELVPVAPDWYRDRRSRYAVAVSGRKPAAGPSPLAPAGATEDLRAPMGLRRRLVFAGRFVLGSLAGAVFVPVGIALAAARAAGRRPVNRVAVAVPRRQAGRLDALWRFSRPHTVIGTTVSIVGLYLIAVDSLPGLGLGGRGVGPLLDAGRRPRGERLHRRRQPARGRRDRSRQQAVPAARGGGHDPGAGARDRERVRRAGRRAGALPGRGGDGRGARRASSSARRTRRPPLRLKRFPVLASLSISGVRSVVVNLGVYAHFSLALGDGTVSIPAPVWALTLFVLPFSLAIAILKDVPDAEGDRRFRIRTFTVRLGGRRVLRAGLAALTLAYLGMAILGPLLIDQAQPAVLVAGHLAALAVLLAWSRGVDPGDRDGFTRFYMRVWKLFFLEYALVALACLAG